MLKLIRSTLSRTKTLLFSKGGIRIPRLEHNSNVISVRRTIRSRSCGSYCNTSAFHFPAYLPRHLDQPYATARAFQCCLSSVRHDSPGGPAIGLSYYLQLQRVLGNILAVHMLNIRLLTKIFSKIIFWQFRGVHGSFPMQQDFLASEELIYLLQRQVLGLRIEEVYEWKEASIENCVFC